MRRFRPRDGRLRGKPPRRGPTRRAHPAWRPVASPSREPSGRGPSTLRLTVAGILLLLLGLLALAFRLA